MKSSHNPHLATDLGFWSRGASWVVIAFGFVELIECKLKVHSFDHIFSQLPSITPATAIAFVLAGFSLWFARTEDAGIVVRQIVQACAAGVALVGAFTLIDYLSYRSPVTDPPWFERVLNTFRPPITERPAILTGLNFLLLGIALLDLGTKKRFERHPVELLAVTAILIALLTLLGHACSAPFFYKWSSLGDTGMEAHTAVAFAALGIGIVCTRPCHGLGELIASPTSGGIMARSLILAPVIIPLATGLMKIAGGRFGAYNAESAAWLFAFLNIYVFTLAIWWSAERLHRAEIVRRRAEEDLQKLNFQLEQRVHERTTELSLSMKTLAESEERVRLIIDTALDAVLTIDQRGIVTSLNREAERIFGWSRQEFLGQTLSNSIIPPRFREMHERGLKRFLATGEGPVLNKRIEIIALHRDGREFPIELAITPVRRGDAFIFNAFIRDLTERNQMDQSRAQFAAIVESSDDAIIGKNLDGTITSWNPGAERIFGYSAQEALTQSMLMLIPEERLHEEHTILEQIKRGESTGHFETVRLRKGGKRFDVSVTVSPIKNNRGEVIGASQIAQDISARKSMETQLKVSQEELRAMAARLETIRENEATRIAREVHDVLGQSLTAVNIDLARMESKILRSGDSAGRTDLLSMLGSVSKLVDSTTKSVQRIASELRPGILDDFGLAAALEWQVEDFQLRTGIRCHWKCREEVASSWDKTKVTTLYRIFQEILTNIARHAKATDVTMELRHGAGSLLLIVADNGAGFDPAKLNDPKSLGLLGMRERMFLVGGKVEVRPGTDRGTTVEVEVPL